MKQQLRSLIIALALSLYLSVAAHGEDWPTFGHDIARSGCSELTLTVPLMHAWVHTALHAPLLRSAHGVLDQRTPGQRPRRRAGSQRGMHLSPAHPLDRGAHAHTRARRGRKLVAVLVRMPRLCPL